jgi:hypothetical protein
MKTFLLSCFVVALAVPSISSAAEDRKPTGTDAKATAAIRRVLKDPFSVREFSLGSPHRATNNFIYPNAWNVCASFYAKNSYGAYNRGAYRVFFKNNQVVDVKGGSDVTIKADCGPMRSLKF